MFVQCGSQGLLPCYLLLPPVCLLLLLLSTDDRRLLHTSCPLVLVFVEPVFMWLEIYHVSADTKLIIICEACPLSTIIQQRIQLSAIVHMYVCMNEWNVKCLQRSFDTFDLIYFVDRAMYFFSCMYPCYPMWKKGTVINWEPPATRTNANKMLYISSVGK